MSAWEREKEHWDNAVDEEVILVALGFIRCGLSRDEALQKARRIVTTEPR